MRGAQGAAMTDETSDQDPEVRAADAPEASPHLLTDAFIEALTQGVIVFANDGRIVRCNRAAEKILGLSADQMAGRTTLDPRWRTIHEDGSPFPGITHPASITLSTGEEVRDVVMGVHKPDGSLAWIWVNCAPVRDGELGDDAAVVATFTDVTEQTELRQRLAESERYFRLIAENVTDIVVKANLDGVIEWVSPSLTAMLGWEPGELVGRNALELAHPEQLTSDLDARDRVRGEALDGFRAQALAADGTYHWVEANLRPLMGDSGEPVGVISSWRVIDAQVAAERELARVAHHDSLTGLLSRAEFLDQFQLMLSHTHRRSERIAAAFCDVDNFKGVNDQFGHAAGDETLHQLAARIQTTLRDNDLIARFGGDEIVVVLPGLNDATDALLVAEKIRRQAEDPIEIKGASVKVTLSVGLAFAQQGDHVDDVISRADSAMYQAKVRGRNRVVLAQEPA